MDWRLLLFRLSYKGTVAFLAMVLLNLRILLWSIKMDILKRIDKDIHYYGKTGDNSLEYLGITVNDAGIKEYKCYRFKSKKIKEEEIVNDPFSSYDFFRYLDSQKDIENKICRINYKVDFSNYKENIDETIEKNLNDIIENTACDALTAKTILQLNRYIKVVLKTQQEPLCVIGGKMDNTGNFLELKIYYQLRVFSKGENISCLAKKKEYFQIIDYIGKLCDLKKQNIKKMKELFNISNDNLFESMMIGVDFDDEIKKVKYYFIRNTKKSTYYNKCDDKMKKFIKKIEKHGLRLKGYAISFCGSKMDELNINFYFCEL